MSSKTLKSNYWFTESEVYRWLIGIQAGFIFIASSILAKFSWNFLKKKNNNLNDLDKTVLKLNKTVSKLDNRLGKVETIIFFTDSDGRDTNITNKIREIKHMLDNTDAGVAGAFGVILDKLDNMDKKENEKDK